MNSLKHPPFFRPSSRPSSPAPVAPPSRPDSSQGFERSRPLHKLTMSTFRRPSPASSPAPSAPTPVPLIQDGSYLETLSLKLSEAVSKALAQPSAQPATTNDVLNGKRPLPTGRGQALGALIATELKAASDNTHLYRAIVRSLHRPLSIVLSSLSSLLVPHLSSPAFLNPPSPTVQNPTPNPTQLHAIGVATVAGELLETFDDFGLGNETDFRDDGLKVVREGLVSLVGRVVNPLVNNIKRELNDLVEALAVPSSNSAHKPASAIKPVHNHPSIVTMQSIMPVHARTLQRYCPSPTSQTTLATLLISVVWRGIVAISHRPYVPGSPPVSPGLAPVKKRRGSPSTTPPLTPPASRFTIKLPTSSSVSRPPSPQHQLPWDTAASDAQALHDLLALLPRPAIDKNATKLAREAVDEAFEGLKSLPAFINASHGLPAKIQGGQHAGAIVDELGVLAKEIPTLVALPVLLQVQEPGTASVSRLLGFQEDEYRQACLSGFARAEECASVVGVRVLETFHAEGQLGNIIRKWLTEEIDESESDD